MRRPMLSAVFLFAALFPACQPTGTSIADQAADFVFTNGKVYTVDSNQEWAEAVAVRGNKIVHVGDADGADVRVLATMMDGNFTYRDDGL